MIPGSDRAPFSLGVALLGTIAGGLTLRFAFPGPSLWWLAPIGVALTLAALRGRTARAGFLLGLVGGLAFWLPLIDWIRYFLGTAGAGDVGLVLLFALATFMSLWGAIGAALIAVVLRRSPTEPGWRLGLVPLIVAGVWTAREGVSGTVPWGGFSWGRVGFSQAGGAIDGLFSWVGASGVTFLTVWLSALVVELIVLRPRSLMVGRTERMLAVAGPVGRAVPAIALALVLVAVPAWTVPTRGSVTVAGVQGNTKSSYADPPEYVGAVLAAQVAQTLTLEGRRLDLVVWPEGGNDVDPLRDPAARQVWNSVVDRLGAPLLGWAVTQRGSQYFNTSLLWTQNGAGPRYDKRHLVPFGEYVPARSAFRAIAPTLVDLLQREYTPGSGASTMALGGGRLAGVFICFDIADDALVRQAVSSGAQFLLAPSNNTDFGRGPDESLQQLQIARVRALETGRSLLAVSTVAPTAVIRPDGTIVDKLPGWSAGTVVAQMPQAVGITPSTAIGGVLERVLGSLGIGGWLALLLDAAMRRRSQRTRER